MKRAFTIKSMAPESGGRIAKMYVGKDANDKHAGMPVYVPVIAWAIIEHHNDGSNTIEPVFLDEHAIPVAFSQFMNDKQNNGYTFVQYEIEEREE